MRTPTNGVFAVGGAPATDSQRAWYAVLATRSPLSFTSSALWWGLPVPDDGLIHITRLARRRIDWPPGVRVHRVGLAESAVTVHRGLDVTTRVQTVLDCLGWLKASDATRLADRALQQRWITLPDVDRRLAEERGRWGNRQLRRLRAQLGDRAAAESERRLHTLLRDAGIRGWMANLPVTLGGRRYEIDVAFPRERLAIEVDGRRYHSDDDQFQTDRTKQNALMRAGWRVLRFTWADIVERPHEVLALITQLLAA